MHKAYICNEPTLFQDTNYDGYQFIGNMPITGSWVKEIVFGEGGEILPTKLGGGSTIYFCDNYFYNANITSVQLHVLAFGGRANNGANDGLFYSFSSNAPSDAYAFFGSRLCFIPEAA